MRVTVQEATTSADALVMAAAVADYRPAEASGEKLKKEAMAGLTLALERTEDIIAAAPDGIVKVAFAAESSGLLKNARSKLRTKGADLVAANDITMPGAGFGSDENKVWLVDETGDTELPLMAKYDVAMAILDRVAGLLDARSPKER